MAGPLHVQLVRSGGFAGMVERRSVDAERLQPPVAGRLRELLAAAGAPPRGSDGAAASNGAAANGAASNGAAGSNGHTRSNGEAGRNGSSRPRPQGMDRYQYEIRVDDGRVRKLVLDEGSMSPPERELVQLLLDC